jgi:hypothetical protein
MKTHDVIDLWLEDNRFRYLSRSFKMGAHLVRRVWVTSNYNSVSIYCYEDYISMFNNGSVRKGGPRVVRLDLSTPDFFDKLDLEVVKLFDE